MARGGRSSYHRGMAHVELGILAAVIIGVLILIITRLTPGAPQRRVRALVGLIPGALGALFVLTQNVDLVPDELETRALPLVILAVSGAIAVITIRGLARH
jgi:hypothetical protein